MNFWTSRPLSTLVNLTLPIFNLDALEMAFKVESSQAAKDAIKVSRGL